MSERVTISPTCRGRSDRKRSPFPSLGIAVGFVLLALGGIAAPASASARVSPENAAATHAYLIATVSFEEAELSDLPQSVAAMEASAAHISGECPGVLTGAPPTEEEIDLGLIGPGSQTSPSGRARGERQRQSRQRSDLQLELSAALDESRTQPDREADEALIRALAPLKWSNPRITLLFHLVVEGAQEELDIPAPAVCADMKTWVTSGYKALSTASKEFESRAEATLKRAFTAIALVAQSHIRAYPEILAPYENATDRALASRSEALRAQLKKGSETQIDIVERLEATVGLPTPKVTQAEPAKRKPVVIGRGKTAAGGSFVARAEPPTRGQRALGCVFVTITEPSRQQSEGLLELGDGIDRCLSRSHIEAEPAVHCNSGLLTVEANLLRTAHSVRLLLSNGDTITSPAIRLPARLGGPAGLYYQVVRGPSPIPVSLTELDAEGRTLTVLKLPQVVECTKHPVKYFPGGIVRLAHGSLPQGPSFTIRGEGYRKLGADHFELKLEVSNEELLFGGGGEGGSLEGSVAIPNGVQVLEPQDSSGCLPQPFAIIYGLLKAPRDTVFARVSGALVPLRKVAIPARLHPGGVLVYGAFTPLPTELLVRNASGKTVDRKNLSQAAKSDTETCEGEAE